MTSQSQDLNAALAEHRWYHTIELADGTVTPGVFDHRPLLSWYPIPSDMRGFRALDVGAADGFWAFELERRGAEVWALDVDAAEDADFPSPVLEHLRRHGWEGFSDRDGFLAARELLDSHVHQLSTSVYDLPSDRWGRFDFVHVGDLLLHLRDPVRALERIRAVTRGEIVIADVFDPDLDGLGLGPGLMHYAGGWEVVTWWVPALSTLLQMVHDAGFRNVRAEVAYNLPARNQDRGLWRAVVRAHG